MKRKSGSGFTVIELMMTVAVLGVLLAIGVPSFRTMVLNNCLTTKTNALVSAMQLARSTAITVREDVSFGAVTCRFDADSNGSADGACDNADDFGQGVVVFRDIDGNGLADPAYTEDVNGNGVLDPGEDTNNNGVIDEELIRVQRFSCAATVDETADVTMFTYTLKGFAETTGQFNVCDERDPGTYRGRQVSLNRAGRPATDNEFICP